MDLMDIVRRPPPGPWAEAKKIPWHEPAFSGRMLAEHLSQDHDAASPRAELIDAHVEWIHGELLSGRPVKVLDLGCGPGLYASRLARLGHECVGIDFSPASVAYAREAACRDGLTCTYEQADMRKVEFGAGFGLAMMLHGELNAFPPAEARAILIKAREALTGDGLLLLAVSTFDSIKPARSPARSWHSAEAGLFSDRPYLCLEENHWDPDAATRTDRWYVIDSATAEVTRLAQTLQAYTDHQYTALLTDCGFADVRLGPALAGLADDLLTLLGRRPADGLL